MSNSQQQQEAIEQEFQMLESFYSTEQLQKETTGGKITGGSFRAQVRIPESGAWLVSQPGGKRRHELRFVPRVSLTFQLPDGYPDTCQPQYCLRCGWLRSQQLVAIGDRLRLLAAERPGEPVLWFWFEFLERELWGFLGLGSELRFNDWDDVELSIHQGSGFSVVHPGGTAAEVEQEVLAVDAEERLAEFRRGFHDCPVCAAARPGLECVQFRPCGHLFCEVCVAAAFRACIALGRPDKLGCLECNEGDENGADPSLVKRMLTPEEFAKYEQQLFDITLSKMGELETCPRCQGQVLVDQADIQHLGHCPGCYHAFCLLCRATYHGTNHCQIRGSSLEKVLEAYISGDGAKRHQMELRYGRAKLRALEEDCRTQKYLSGLPKCPACKTYVEKSDGCNKMTCYKCKTFFCWLCSASLDPLDPYGHYRGGGAGKCAGKLFEGLLPEGALDI